MDHVSLLDAGTKAADRGVGSDQGHGVGIEPGYITRLADRERETGKAATLKRPLVVRHDQRRSDRVCASGIVIGGKDPFGVSNREGLSEIPRRCRVDERTDAFSGGMKRRLNIGLGLLNDPTLLVLDEPTVGVDPQSRNAILDSVEVLAREGMAVLYTTHYMEEAERLCDRVGILDEGKLKAEEVDAKVRQLLSEPK